MKKIDKRACRKVAQEPVYIYPGNALLYIPDILYVLRSSVRNISGKRLLVIYFIPVKTAAAGDTTPKYVLFQGKDDFITLENCEDGKTRWRTTKTRWMDNVTRSVCAFLTLNDSKRVIRFCDPRIEIAFEALSHLQHKIRTVQGEQRHINSKKKIAQLMRPVDRRPLPKDIQEWMNWNVIPAHIFYRRRKGKTLADGYCTRCKSDVVVDRPKHKETGICPSCQAEVTFQAAGRAKRVYEQETVQVLQHVGDQLVARICKATVSFRDYRNPQLHFWEAARIFYSVSNGKYSEEEYYYALYGDLVTPWKKGPRPIFSRYVYSFNADLCGHIYPRNLSMALKGTPWQYSQLKEFYQHYKTNMTLSSYLYVYHKRPAIEYDYAGFCSFILNLQKFINVKFWL